MKRLVAAVVALVAIAACSGAGSRSAQAQTPTHPCFGAPAAYVAAFDAADGTVDGAVSYPEPRWYNEQQTWATHRFETPGHHSEHVHFGLCIPNAQTMTATFRLDLGYTFHNMQDYIVTSANESAVTDSGSDSLWTASASQLQQLNDAAQASCSTCPNNVQHVYFSVQTLPPKTNGLKEIRGAIGVSASGPNAVFQEWRTDPRWYETDNFAGLPDSTPKPNQLVVRVRPVIAACKADGDPATCGDLSTAYHHSGLSGQSPQDTTTCGNVLSGTNSAVWDADFIAQPWSGDHTVCLYVSDGGGPALMMIDPDFHNHYAADGTSPTTSNVCPNVDAAGNCLGKWFWQPSNTRKEIRGGPSNVPVTIPASVIDSLSPGVHKLVFKSDDFAECVREADFVHWNDCPLDVRGAWTNISVLPFSVGDSQAPSVPTELNRGNAQPSSIKLSWQPSTDNVGVVGYRVYRDGVQVADVSDLFAQVGGLSAPKHLLEVEAYDAVGNVSPRAGRIVKRTWIWG